jgi:hypothetical protein
MTYDMRSHTTELLMAGFRADDEALAPKEYNKPFPGVVDRYAVADFGRSDAGAAASDVFRIDLGAIRQRTGGVRTAIQGTGLVAQIIPSDFWIPQVPEAAHWKEFWLAFEGAGEYYEGLQVEARPRIQMLVASEDLTVGVTPQLRLTPANAITFTHPIRLEEMSWSICTPVSRITFPQMRYPSASTTYDGAGNATIVLGAGHGVLVGEFLVPTTRSRLLAAFPHGVEVAGAAADSVTVTVPASVPAGNELVTVFVERRWVRIPFRIRALGHSTNYGAPGW